MIYVVNSLTASQRATNMAAFRSSQYKEDDLVQAWDDKSKAKLYVTGDTAVFAFDSFVNEAVYHFKWSLDYAKEKGVKRFAIDLSCNSGGNAAVVMYIMAMITNQNEDSYTASYRKMQTLTGNLSRVDNDLDLNLDGVINDLDKSVYYDFEYAFITSNISYSCGNLLPCLAKDAGFPILGERSGGGACSLLIAYTPETFFYTMSSYNKFITKDNKDVDSGAALDYDLTKQASDGSDTDYTGLYDAAAYSTLIDEFYAKGSYLYGDVNYNGEIDIDDASLIQRAGIDLAKLTDTQRALADVNGDGRVSILDVTCVQKYLAEYTSGTGKTGAAYTA